MKLYTITYENKISGVTTTTTTQATSIAALRAQTKEIMKTVKNHPLRIKSIKLTACGYESKQK